MAPPKPSQTTEDIDAPDWEPQTDNGDAARPLTVPSPEQIAAAVDAAETVEDQAKPTAGELAAYLSGPRAPASHAGSPPANPPGPASRARDEGLTGIRIRDTSEFDSVPFQTRQAKSEFPVLLLAGIAMILIVAGVVWLVAG